MLEKLIVTDDTTIAELDHFINRLRAILKHADGDDAREVREHIDSLLEERHLKTLGQHA